MTHNALPSLTFSDLGLSTQVLKSLSASGYLAPSAIQSQIMPLIMAGRDVIGQAQTGTGKTAAFACPLLSQIDISLNSTQVLVMTPTRELAIQVAEAFEKYGSEMKNLRVRAIYGGQDIRVQLKHLKRGAHIVVGTPGRIIDHLKRQTLVLDAMKCIVLDEADEMLRMGFVEDIDTILSKSPAQKQVALFSATMPKPIQRIAKTYLQNPEHVSIELKTTTCENIRQRYCALPGREKMDGLVRILETEEIQAVLIFVRTKLDTAEVADKLRARGHLAEALSGDVKQIQREKIIEKLKNGELNIVVATDVAARGIDVERISHVINYDIPFDVESYVHRIGRTGRAGRKGDAILFVSPRDQRMLRSIEKETRQKITEMSIPSLKKVNARKVEQFKEQITEILSGDSWHPYLDVVTSYQEEFGVKPMDLAAALCMFAHKDTSLFMREPVKTERRSDSEGSIRGADSRREKKRSFGSPRSKDRKPHRKPYGKPNSRTDRRGGGKPPSGRKVANKR